MDHLKIWWIYAHLDEGNPFASKADRIHQAIVLVFFALTVLVLLIALWVSVPIIAALITGTFIGAILCFGVWWLFKGRKERV